MFSGRLLSLGRQLLNTNLFQNVAPVQTAIRSSSFLKKNWDPNKFEILKQPVVNPAICDDVIASVNEKLNDNAEGRLFAVVHLCGKQFKVTAGDIIIIEGYWAPTIGDQLKLEKVLLVGGEEFSLIGRPMVQPGLVDVYATVIEKTLSHTKTHFRKKRRKQYMNIKFHRSSQSMIRINSITLNGNVNENIKPMPGQHIYQ